MVLCCSPVEKAHHYFIIWYSVSYSPTKKTFAELAKHIHSNVQTSKGYVIRVKVIIRQDILSNLYFHK